MKYLKLKYLFCFFVLNFSFVQHTNAQTFKNEQERIKYAEKLFEDGKYIEATPHYLHFLSLDQTSYDLNFKYGVCLIHSDADKTNALKYLQYAIKSPSINPLAHYYLARALQISFRFTSAISQYEKFKTIAPKLYKSYYVDNEIRACNNGKELLKSFSEIIVLSKKEARLDRIQYSYELEGMNGKLLTTDQFQSKIDKKKGHLAIVFFPDAPNGKIVYSSYGEDESNGLDLYMVSKLPGGGLSLPTKLPDNINTPYDDNFGFLHPDGVTFYFCSKGHNSMGGYDIFKSNFNASSNSFSKPTNLDFKINTPADDILYITDNQGDYAYFSSNRASKGGYFQVYHIRNKTIPFSNFVIAGTFKNRISSTSSITIKVEDDNANLIGVFSSQPENGIYSIKLPRAGNYNYFVDIEGSTKLYAAKVDVPSDKGIMIKQELILDKIDGDVMLIVRNLFDEPVEASEDLLAKVFLEISDVEENVSKFKNDSGEMSDEDFFAELGIDIKNATEEEFLKVVDDIVARTKNNTVKKEENLKKAYSIADEKSKEADSLRILSDELLDKANKETNELKRRSLKDEAIQARVKAKIASQQAYLALEYAKEVEKTLVNNKENTQRVEQLATDLKTDIKNKKSETVVDKLRGLQQIAKSVESETNSATDISKVIDKKIEDTQLDLETLETKLSKTEKNKQLIKEEIAELEKQKEEAKKSQKDIIQKQIDEANESLVVTDNQISEQKSDIDFAKKQMELMKSQKNEIKQTFVNTDSEKVDKTYTQEEQKLIAERTEKVVKETSEVQEQLTQEPQPEVKTEKSILTEERYVELENEYKTTATITDSKQQLLSQKQVSEKYLKTINQDIAAIESKISQANGDDKTKLESNLKDLKTAQQTKENELKQQNNSLLAISKDEIDKSVSMQKYKELDNQYSAISSQSATSQNISKLQEINTDYLTTIDKDISALNEKNQKSNNEIEKLAVQQKISELELKKSEKQKEQLNLQNLAKNQTNDQSKQSKSTEISNTIKQADKNYESLEQQLSSTNSISDNVQKSQQKVSINKEWSKAIEQEKTNLKKDLSLASTPEEKTLIQNRLTELDKQEKERTAALKNSENELAIETAKATIAQTKDDKKYQSNIQKINQIEDKNYPSEEEKLLAKKQAQSEYINQIRKDVDVLEKSSKTINDASLKSEISKEIERLTKKEIDLRQQVDATSAQLAQLNANENKTVVNSLTKPTYSNLTSQKLYSNTQSSQQKVEQLRKKEDELKAKAESDGPDSKSAKDYKKAKEDRFVAENDLINAYKEPNSKEMEHVKQEVEITKKALEEKEVSEDKLQEIALIEKNADKLFAHAKNLRYQATISPTNEVANTKLNNAYKEELQAIEEMNKAKLMYEDLAKQSNIKPKQLATSTKLSEEGTGIAVIAKTTEFKSEQAKQTMAKSNNLIDEISEIDSKIQAINKVDKPTKKQQQEKQVLASEKTQKEVQLAKELSKANELEIQFNNVDKSIVQKDLAAVEINNELKEFKSATDKEEQSIQRLLEESKQLEKQAENTKDLEQKKELYRQANIKKGIAILKQNDVIESYNKIMVENLLIQDTKSKIAENNNLSNQQKQLSYQFKTEAEQLYVKSDKVKDSLANKNVSEKEIEFASQQLRKQGDVKIQISEMLENNANDIKSLEDNLMLQAKIFKDLTSGEVDQIRTDKTYQKHYELSEQKAQKEKELNKQVVALAKEELRIQSLINKGEQYEFEANVATNSDIKSELLQKAAEVKEEAQVSETKIEQMEVRINELLNEIQVLENSIATNFGRIQASQKNKMEAVYAKAEDNKPLDKQQLAQQNRNNQRNTTDKPVDTSAITQRTQQNKTTEVKKVDVTNFETPKNVTESIFSKTDNNRSAYSSKSRIPINTKPIEGLVYRVQIGAFSKPVPDELFSGFAPISGEQIDGTSLVRYYAGYFNQFDNANSAKNDIRTMPNYKDAFVVAFYNGKKISIAEARALEQNKVNTNELVTNKVDLPNTKTSTEDNKQPDTKQDEPTFVVTQPKDTSRVKNFTDQQTQIPLQFSVNRVVEQSKGGVIIRIKFTNGTPTSNTKIIEQIPQNFKVEALTKSGATLTQQGTTLTFSWDAFVPDVTEVAYVLYPQTGVTNQRYEVNGVFRTAKGDDLTIKPTGYFEYRYAPAVAETKTETKEEVNSKEVTLDTTKASYYKDVKGAAKAEQVEVIKGLFFTVQVGVYSKPVPPSALYNITPLNTELLKNGTIRYTTSRLKSVEEAIVRKDEIRLIGVSDAFVTAYYNGERITIAEAKKLLQDLGSDILAK